MTPRQDRGEFPGRLVLPAEFMQHYEKESWLKCQWDGEASGWQDFFRRVRLAFERTPRKKRHLLGAEVVGQLTGRAWVVTQEVEHRRLVRRDGVMYLIDFLRDKLGKTPIPDVGLRLEQLIIKLRRTPGTSMSTWASQLRHSYRQLQIALARARRDTPAKETSSSSPVSTPLRPRSSRRASRETVDEPQAEAPTEDDEDETETVAGLPEEDDHPATPAAASPTRSPGGRSPTRRDRRGSDSDDSAKALKDLELWDKYEERLEEALPSELLGWLLLRRAGLTPQGRLSVQAASGNSLRLEKIEVALRSMEDELVAQEQSRNPGPHHRRRTFWVEDEGHWSILLADDADLSEVLENVSVHYVGSEAAFHLDNPEGYGGDSWEDPENSYWGYGEGEDWLPDDDPSAVLSAEELAQVEEAYQAADSKLQSFVDARKAVRARHLSRDFYPFSPQSKGFRSTKGKGRGRGPPPGKGRGPKGGKPSSSTSPAMPVLTTEASALAVSPGQPGYSGCFICGDRSHQFRNCPRRSAKGSSKGTGKVHFGDTSEVFMVTAEDPTTKSTAFKASSSATSVVPELPTQVLDQAMLTATSSTAFRASSSTTSVVPELPTQVLDQAMLTATSSTAFRASSSTTPVVPCRDSNQVAYPCNSTSLPEVLNVQEVYDGDSSLSLQDSLEDMVMVQRTGGDNDLDGYAVLDSGATETVGSLPALEALMLARFHQTGKIERVTVTSTPMKRFKFGNGSQDMSASHILLPVMLGQHAVPMGVYTLDVSGVPLLIGIKTLRRLHAVLDCHRDVLVLGAVDPNRGVQLKRSSSGHLLLDLRQDLMVHSFSLFQPHSRQPRSDVASGEETAFMIEPSDDTPQICRDTEPLVDVTAAISIGQELQPVSVSLDHESEHPGVPESAGEPCEAVFTLLMLLGSKLRRKLS